MVKLVRFISWRYATPARKGQGRRTPINIWACMCRERFFDVFLSLSRRENAPYFSWRTMCPWCRCRSHNRSSARLLQHELKRHTLLFLPKQGLARAEEKRTWKWDKWKALSPEPLRLIEARIVATIRLWFQTRGNELAVAFRGLSLDFHLKPSRNKFIGKFRTNNRHHCRFLRHVPTSCKENGPECQCGSSSCVQHTTARLVESSWKSVAVPLQRERGEFLSHTDGNHTENHMTWNSQLQTVAVETFAESSSSGCQIDR